MPKGYFRVMRPTVDYGKAVFTNYGRPHSLITNAVSAATRIQGRVVDINTGRIVFDNSPTYYRPGVPA